MTYFIHIFLNNIVPLAVMILIGAAMFRAFRLDIKTLSKLNFYVFAPALVFVKLYESELSVAILGQVLLFFLLFFTAISVMTELFVRIRKYKGGMKGAMRNSIIFYNSANYAIPLNQMVFVGDAFTLSVQMIVMMMQNLLPNTLGVYNVNAHKSSWKDMLKTVAYLPTIYMIPLAFILRHYQIAVPQPLNIPLHYIADGFMATALLTLGVQLGSMKWAFRFSDVLWSNFLRLCMGPLIGLGVVWLLGLHGVMAQALVLSCAVPTSLSSVLLAVEYDNEPEFSSQAVFMSTVLSMFTVTLVIYLLPYIG
ncbi:transporter [Paenibacillus chitinolyticus]|uniref:AEC family transporter n=1 Tax=Paenibacillus chitinolyticus TaxID=79263 RepID=UPI0026E4F880|nr:AEC family transporter [Paenibacillus chitinolyticus]GKS10174.1 transporter [Paenibacillus chitinolyticus]